ncbi:MAG: DUF4430 domain-containing protein [Salinarimonas sp.]
MFAARTIAGTALAALLLLPASAGAQQAFEQATVSLEVDVPGVTDVTITGIPLQPGQTPLDVLQVTQTAYIAEWFPSLGQYFITSIDGNAASGSSQWALCIDGELAPVGAGSYVLAPDAEVEFILTSASEPC